MKKNLGFFSIFCISSGAMISSGLFVLPGSKDLRNLHLRALTAIAQVVHHPEFEQRWLEAKSHMDLKDLFLLGERRRTSGQ